MSRAEPLRWLPSEHSAVDALDWRSVAAWLVERPGLPYRSLPGMEQERWVVHTVDELARMAAAPDTLLATAPDVPCLLVFRKLAWDTRITGVPIALLEWLLFPHAARAERMAEIVRAAALRLRDEGSRLIIHKASAADVTALEALGRAGFDLLTVHLDYILDAERAAGERHEVPGYEFGVARTDEEEAIGELSAGNFALFDRFQVDRLVPRASVPEVYREWARNSVRGFADLVWVARRGGRVCGFGTWSARRSLAERTGVACAWYGLGAVAESERGRGLFRRITGGALAHLHGTGIRWGVGATNALNIATQRTFAALGGWNQGPILTFRKDLLRD